MHAWQVLAEGYPRCLCAFGSWACRQHCGHSPGGVSSCGISSRRGLGCCPALPRHLVPGRGWFQVHGRAGGRALTADAVPHVAEDQDAHREAHGGDGGRHQRGWISRKRPGRWPPPPIPGPTSRRRRTTSRPAPAPGSDVLAGGGLLTVRPGPRPASARTARPAAPPPPPQWRPSRSHSPSITGPSMTSSSASATAST